MAFQYIQESSLAIQMWAVEIIPVSKVVSSPILIFISQLPGLIFMLMRDCHRLAWRSITWGQDTFDVLKGKVIKINTYSSHLRVIRRASS